MERRYELPFRKTDVVDAIEGKIFVANLDGFHRTSPRREQGTAMQQELGKSAAAFNPLNLRQDAGRDEQVERGLQLLLRVRHVALRADRNELHQRRVVEPQKIA